MDIVNSAEAIGMLWMEVGLLGFLVILVGISVVGFFYLARRLAIADQKRDEQLLTRDMETSRLINAQIGIMTTQQTEFSKLNEVIIESLQEKNALLEKSNETNIALANAINNLGSTFDLKQKETHETLTLVLEHQTQMKDELKQILEGLKNERQNTMIMVSAIDRLAKKISTIGTQEPQYCVEWKEMLNERLKSIETCIKLILEGIKDEENHNVNGNPVN